MESKVVAVFFLLCLSQGINAKALGGVGSFWGGNPFLAANPFFAAMNPAYVPMNPELIPIVSELQTRLSQVQQISKSSIGISVGIASKTVALSSAQAKLSVKTLINGVKNNPTATKECLTLTKPNVEQVNTQSKTQLSFCSKSAQTQIKGQSQQLKTISLQAATLNQELNAAVSQCQLANPAPTETSNVTSCVSARADELRERISALEQSVQDTVQQVDANIATITTDASSCTQQVQQSVQEQVQALQEQQEQCSTPTTTAQLL